MPRQVNLGQIVPNIQIGTTTTGLPNTQASVENVGTSLNPILNFTIPKGEPGAIKMQIVAELPETGSDDTIYLVPITPDIEGNNYAEYVWINNAWELLGKIGVQLDLSDYYTKQETNTLLSGKANTSDIPTKVSQLQNDSGFITNQVSNLANYYTKTEIDATIGDINTALDLINGEVI